MKHASYGQGSEPRQSWWVDEVLADWPDLVVAFEPFTTDLDFAASVKASCSPTKANNAGILLT